MEKLDQKPFFFILGRPRSGTTLLRTLFDAHPNVQIPPECKFILDLYPKYGKKKSWSEKDLAGFYDDLVQQWRFDIWTIDLEGLKNDLISFTGEAPYSRICKVVYDHYRSFYEKDEMLWFGDKNPGYTIYTERLLKIFPDAKFIQILRDYRDNYVSVKDVDFELPVPSLVATKWKLFYKNVRRASLKNPDRYITVRYEDLVDDPEKEMKTICAFLGIVYRPEMLEFYKKEDEIFKVYPKEFITKYHANLVNKVNKSRSGIWKQKLSVKEVMLADLAVGRTAEEAGYQRQYNRFGISLYLLASPGIILAYALAFLTLLVDKFPYQLRMLILNRGPIAVAKIFLKIFRPAKYREIRNRMK
ncbi:MAG: sulfotransferase [Bacteroidales bacterium]|nr:sulfotransferase [Bacteroidales bacterium]